MSGDDTPTRPGSDGAPLFEEASRVLLELEGLQGEELERAVVQHCAGRPELAALVTELLQDLESAQGFLEDAPGDRLRAMLDAAALPEGQRFGSYRVLRGIAQGGMGTVYEAEQASPRRRVALKVISPGLATPQVLRRFRLEGEVLARLSHPGIARVLETSEPDAVPPWFAMELVDGLPLTEHAQRENLGTRERLELLAATCDAVAHAHASGIVHRDLKPSNILVDREGCPKVLDFGVARAIGWDSEASALLTKTGDLVGTLAYMSPEQAWGRKDDIDARSDVFSLGVLGFELLTGRLPRRLEGLAVGQALDVLRDGEVDRAESVDPELAGDVSTLLARALESEPERRYANAAEFAADIRRSLRDEPIVARPASFRYRTTKLIRRHRALAATTATAFLLLSVVTALALNAAWQAAKANRRAESQAYRATLAAAAAELELGNPHAARLRLAEAPEPRRGWEWRVLQAKTGGPDVSAPLQGVIALSESEEGDRLLVLFERDGEVRLAEREIESLAPIRETALDPRELRLPPELLRGAVRALAEQGHDVLTLEPGGPNERTLRLPSGSDWRLLGTDRGVRRALARKSGAGGTVLLDLERGRVLLEDLEDAAQFSADGAFLVGHGVATVSFRSSETGQLVSVMERPLGDAGEARDDGYLSILLPDGEGWYSASYGAGGTLRRWDAEGRIAAEASPGAKTTWGADSWAASEEAGLLAWSSGDGTVHLLDALTLETRGRVRLLEARPLGAMHLSRAGDRLVAFDGERLHAWDLSAALEPLVLRGHEGYVYGVSFDAGGERIASASWDETVRVWERATGRELHRLRAPREPDVPVAQLVSARFLADGERLVAADFNGRVFLFDPGSAEPLRSRWVRLTGGLQSAPLDPRGELLVLCAGGPHGAGRVIRLEDFEDAVGWASVPGPAAFRPDGSEIAVLAQDGQLRLHSRDGAELRTLARLPPPPDRFYLMRWDPHDRLLLPSRDGSVLVLDADTGAELLRLRAQGSGEVWDVVSSPDGSRIATGSDDGGVRIWDASTGELLATWAGHGLYVHALAWSPDGELLLSASGDRTIRRWDAALSAAGAAGTMTP